MRKSGRRRLTTMPYELSLTRRVAVLVVLSELHSWVTGAVTVAPLDRDFPNTREDE
jgi:hypothetical protein